MRKNAIGFFDSGFGGLSIMRDVVKLMPQYDYTYLGDSARCPYGPLTTEQVRSSTMSAMDYLLNNGCSLVVIACNTASSQALKYVQQVLRDKPEVRVLGVVRPIVEVAAEISANGRIGLIGTDGTVASGAYNAEIAAINPNVELFSQACPGLVPMIESGEHHSPLLQSALHEYLQPLIDQQIDTLILGCTHYGLIADDIDHITGPGVKLINEGRIVAEKLQDYLHRHPELESRLKQSGARQFLSTKADDHFNQLASEFYGQKVTSKQVELSDGDKN